MVRRSRPSYDDSGRQIWQSQPGAAGNGPILPSSGDVVTGPGADLWTVPDRRPQTTDSGSSF